MKEINRNDDLNKDMLTTQGGNKMKKMKKLLKNQKGLTLIELLAVIVILAIVAAIAVPAIGNIIDNSRDKAILADASSIISGAKLAYTNGACGTDEICSAAELKDYVDGITLDNASVKKETWELTWSGLSGFSAGSEFAVTSPATEEAILKKLNGKK